MNDKERVDALLKLVEIANGRHDARRNIEWKVSFTFWTAIAVATGFMYRERIVTPQWIFAVYIAVWVTYTFIWLRGLWVANENDMNLSRHYRKQGDRILRNPEYKITMPPRRLSGKNKWFGFLHNWAMLFHAVATGFLLSVSYLFVSSIRWGVSIFL